MRGDHYFARRPASAPAPRTIEATLRGRRYRLETAGGVFARRGVDPGTRLLVEALEVRPGERVLDLGCGIGVLGIVAASLDPGSRVVMVDINGRAAALAARNAAANGVGNAAAVQGDAADAFRAEAFDVVVTNPPIRAGRAVVRRFIEGARAALRPGGRFYLVARTSQGARTLGRLMDEAFGAVDEIERGAGYRVYRASKAAPA